MGPGPGNPAPRSPLKVYKWDAGPPLKFKGGTPGPSSKFKGRIPGPPSKFKSGTLIIVFLHCVTYFVLDKYIYNVEIIFHDGIVGIVSYILCSEHIYRFREIFKVTLGCLI